MWVKNASFPSLAVIDLVAGEAHGVRWLVKITALESNDAETRYRDRRGNVSEDRNVAGQYYVAGEVLRNV